MDPLDGSSNIDVNVSVGTIFYLPPYYAYWQPVTLDDFLQPGNRQVAAGYVVCMAHLLCWFIPPVVVFMPSPTILLLGFSVYLNESVHFPPTENMYSINEGNYIKFPFGVKKYIKYCQEGMQRLTVPYTTRYIGSRLRISTVTCSRGLYLPKYGKSSKW